MKVVELLKIGKILLETLQESCIKSGDVKYLDMYDEYVCMVNRGNKTSYISSVLSNKYGISERQFFYLIKRLSKDCTMLDTFAGRRYDANPSTLGSKCSHALFHDRSVQRDKVQYGHVPMIGSP